MKTSNVCVCIKQSVCIHEDVGYNQILSNTKAIFFAQVRVLFQSQKSFGTKYRTTFFINRARNIFLNFQGQYSFSYLLGPDFSSLDFQGQIFFSKKG